MNKLIELLDEYDSVQYHKINHKIENGSIYRNVGGTDGWYEVWRYCKKFGFIKWLVDNNKIDLDACEGEKTYNNLTASRDSNYSQYERLLMALAISEDPITLLVDCLK